MLNVRRGKTPHFSYMSMPLHNFFTFPVELRIWGRGGRGRGSSQRLDNLRELQSKGMKCDFFFPCALQVCDLFS